MLTHAKTPQGSRQKLEVAMKALETQNVYEPDTTIYQNALNIIRSSSMNCYTFQARSPWHACIPMWGDLACMRRVGGSHRLQLCLIAGMAGARRQPGATR